MELLYFILGMLFMELAVPIFDFLINTLATTSELVKYKLSVSVAKYNSEIQKYSEDEEPVHNVIGFEVPSENYYEEEDDDE